LPSLHEVAHGFPDALASIIPGQPPRLAVLGMLPLKIGKPFGI
jgi:hypothetical protein